MTFCGSILLFTTLYGSPTIIALFCSSLILKAEKLFLYVQRCIVGRIFPTYQVYFQNTEHKTIQRLVSEMALSEANLIDKLKKLYPDGLIYADQYIKKTGLLTYEIHKQAKICQKTRIE